jgi:hypothetical protein
MTEIEIRPSTTGTTTSSEPTLTLSQVRALLADVAAVERASRPIVLHAPAEPATAPQAAVYPMVGGNPTYVRYTTTSAPRERNVWPLAFMVSACVGIGSCLVTAVTGSVVPMLVTLAAFAVWASATYQLVFVREP